MVLLSNGGNNQFLRDPTFERSGIPQELVVHAVAEHDLGEMVMK